MTSVCLIHKGSLYTCVRVCNALYNRQGGKKAHTKEIKNTILCALILSTTMCCVYVLCVRACVCVVRLSALTQLIPELSVLVGHGGALLSPQRQPGVGHELLRDQC